MTANETLLLWVDWLDFYFYTNICRDYLWYDCSDDVFPFTLTDDGVYANTVPMKIIVSLNVEEKMFDQSTEKKYFVYMHNHDFFVYITQITW